MKKRLLKIKWENLLLILVIPLAIIQFLKASIDFKLVSIMMSLILYGGIYYTINITRQEELLKVKDEIEKPILSEIYAYLSIKKEIIKQAIYKRPSLYILRACFK